MGDITYTDKMTTAETIQYILRKMGDEAATDGFDKEFEDLVDLLCLIISPLIVAGDQEQEWRDLDEHGKGLKIQQTLEMGLAKRVRIHTKMFLAMKVIHKNRMLFRNINTYKWDFDPEEKETKVSEG